MAKKIAGSTVDEVVSLPDRLSFLRKNPAFAILPSEVLLDLAKNLDEENFRPDEVVIKEGAEADRLYLIVKGLAEVAAATPNGEVVLGRLGPGEIFGEMALLSPGARRTATVRATKDLYVLSLKSAIFAKLLQAHPDTKAVFESSAELLRTATFLKQASPFSTLSSDDLKKLADRLKKISLPEKVCVIGEGEEGDSCFLIRRGQVEVVINEGKEGERVLAILEAGSIFGEAALLTKSPRNATVRTVSQCEFFELGRNDLVEVMGQDLGISGRMMELLSLRGRPCRIGGVAISHRITPDNQTITILKDPARHAYFQLSPEGWFVWQRLDGEHTLRDITLEYIAEFKLFAPHTIAEVIGRLSGAGFILDKRPSLDVQKIFGRVSFWRRATMLARGIAEYRVMWRNVDNTFTALYQKAGRFFFSGPAQILMAALAISGVIIFSSEHLDLLRELPKIPEGPIFCLLLVMAFLFAILMHELGHALTTKAFGREVLGIGIGWYWFGPVAFVDTSDMWLASRWPRIAVTIAGSYTNLILAGAGSLIALVVSNPHVQLGAWFFALCSYTIVLVNLNPLLEYDGYYVLIDILDHPNLRAHCLLWLGRELPQALKSPRRFRGHALELLYGIGSLLYVLIMVALAMLLYHIVLKEWIVKILPEWAASGLAWVIALAIAAACVLAVAGELRSGEKR